MSRQIDYLFEDPVIPSQKFALISIVGPNMKQKCDVWGLKIRGIAESIDTAKALCKKLLRIDNNYDIYTVEVGKFFPLNVNPLQVQDVEYQNDQLNNLIKSYLENRQNADELWHKRKAEMIEDAIKEGKNQEEFANKPEHPISVLHRIKNYENSIEETMNSLKLLQEDLERTKNKFEDYSQEDKDLALNQITNMTFTESSQIFSVDEIHKEIEDELNNESDKQNELQEILYKIKSLEQEKNELITFKQSLPSTTPKVYERVESSLLKINNEIEELKTKLNNKDLVNEYINGNYQNSQYNFD